MSNGCLFEVAPEKGEIIINTEFGRFGDFLRSTKRKATVELIIGFPYYIRGEEKRREVVDGRQENTDIPRGLPDRVFVFCCCCCTIQSDSSKRHSLH